MIKFLVTSYEKIVAFALWVFFIFSAIIGVLLGNYANSGFIGLVIGLVVAFLFCVFFIAPFLIIADIRTRVLSIEKILIDRATSKTSIQSSSNTSMSQSSEADSSMEGVEDTDEFDESGKRIFKGVEIVFRDEKYFVGDQSFSTLGQAKRHITDRT